MVFIDLFIESILSFETGVPSRRFGMAKLCYMFRRFTQKVMVFGFFFGKESNWAAGGNRLSNLRERRRVVKRDNAVTRIHAQFTPERV